MTSHRLRLQLFRLFGARAFRARARASHACI